MRPEYDPEDEAWQTLARAMERNVSKLLARFDAKLEQASEELADEIQAFLADQAGEK